MRRETFKGRSHIVVPLTLLKGDQVLNGSQGPLLYPKDEVSSKPGIWNHIPLTVNHPTDDNGRSVSARNPAVLEKHQIGFVFNDRWNGVGRVAEGWFDEEDTKKLSPTIYDRLISQKPIELSTGLHTKNHPVTNGRTASGVRYSHIAREYIPDHLAILPDDKGACSVKDGCGVFVGNSQTNNCGGKGGKPGPCPEGNSEGEHGVHKVGSFVHFREPVVHYGSGNAPQAGTKKVVGRVTLLKPDGMLEVKRQDGGYSVKHHSEVTANKKNCGCKTPEKCSCKDKTMTTQNVWSDAARRAAALKRKQGGSSGVNPNIIGRAKPTSKGAAEFEGKGYLATGKKGKSNHDDSDLEEHEHYESGHRVWIDKGHNVHADSREEAEERRRKKKPVTNTRLKGSTMNEKDRDALISELTTNCECWKDQEETLSAMTDNQLAMVAKGAGCGPDDDEDDGAEKPAPDKKKPPFAKKPPVMNNEGTSVKDLPAEDRLTEDEIETLNFARQLKAAHRKNLVDQAVIANASGKEAAKALRPIYEKLPSEDLQVIINTASQKKSKEPPMEFSDFFGSGLTGNSRNRFSNEPAIDEDDVLVPTTNVSIKASTNGSKK